MKTDTKLVKPSLHEVFLHFFDRAPSGAGEYELPNGLVFFIESNYYSMSNPVCHDLVCNFGNIGWGDVTSYSHLFEALELSLRNCGFIKGEVVIKSRRNRTLQDPPQSAKQKETTMRIDKKLVRATINGVFANYFRPSGHGDCFLLPNGLEFAVFIVGDDVVCDFGNLGWIGIEIFQDLFISVEDQLKGHSLMRGEVVLRYRSIRDAMVRHWRTPEPPAWSTEG